MLQEDEVQWRRVRRFKEGVLRSRRVREGARESRSVPVGASWCKRPQEGTGRYRGVQ